MISGMRVHIDVAKYRSWRYQNAESDGTRIRSLRRNRPETSQKAWHHQPSM